VLLRLFAPVVPYITDEIWSWAFAEDSGHPSIHRAPWPTASELAGAGAPADPDSFTIAAAAYAAINKRKSEVDASAGRLVRSLVVAAPPSTAATLRRVADDVMAAARCGRWTLQENPALAAGELEIVEMTIEPAAEAGA